ncbi:MULTISPECIES: hypothetical protein [unclassified Bradyrhizobium]|uniref:hypothetical protein n=1 Tax=unclassified Bradyrhizobium TaxID=2631580 RepID=UPI0028F009F9|nr:MULTISPECIES: hypothetical protein [unclassified Bradyrhizobium]
MGLVGMAVRHTEPMRRLALQIAAQLPENIEDARTVLDQVADLLENFMIAKPHAAWLWRRHSVSTPSRRLSPLWAVVLTLATLLLVLPLGVGSALASGQEVFFVWVLLYGVIVDSLVFGRWCGVLLALLGCAGDKIFVASPGFALLVPSLAEVARAVGLVVLALWLPGLVRRADALRNAISRGVTSLDDEVAAVRSRCRLEGVR